MKPHKWAKEIIAWANGAEIEQRCHSPSIKEIIWSDWEQFDGDWTEEKHWEYRIKPQPKISEKKYYREIAKKALAIPEINEALDRLIDSFSEKEPQYLYVYFDAANNKYDVDTKKPCVGEYYIGKIPLITETDNG